MNKIRGRKKKINADHWGKRLSDVLKEKNLSHRAAAKAAGVSASVLSSWVRLGASPSDLNSVKRLADALDIDFTWLLTGELPKKQSKVSMAEMFEETPYFDGIARIRIDRLVPRRKDNKE